MPSDLGSLVVLDDRLMVVVDPKHPWSSRGTVDAKELLNADLIVLPPGTGARTALDATLDQLSPSAPYRWEVSTPVFVELLASRGLGVGVVSETTCSEWTTVRAIPITSSAARSRLGIVWPASPTHAARAYIESCRAHIAQPG